MALLKTNTGIGTTNPTSALHVIGDVLVTGVVTSTTFNGNINAGVGTVTTLSSTNATITNINSSGITTVGFITASNAYVAGIITAPRFSTGATGTAINITSNSITGPSSIVIDPAGIGDDTGAVRIKGDLYVDGTQFLVNSSTIELADLRVGIATTVGSNLLLDGGGIGIGSTNILKTFTYNYASDSLKSSENLDIASGKTYKINGTDVLSNNTLGSGVIYSSLQYLGTLNNLNVSGLSTLPTLVGTYATITEITNTRFSSGIGTITNLFGTNLTYTNSDFVNLNADYGYIATGIVTQLTGTYLDFSSPTGIASVFDIRGNTLSYTNSDFAFMNADFGYIVAGVVTSIDGTNLNYTGVGTIATLNTGIGTILNLTGNSLNVGLGSIATLYSTNSYINSGIVTNLTGTQLNYTGVGTIATLNSTYTNLTNINATGISTLADIRAERVTVTGIVTANSFRPSSGYIQAADGTNSFYIYNSTGNVSFQGTIGVNQINNGGGYQVITFNNIDTRLTGNLNIAGVTTSSVFNGNIYSLGVSTFRNGPVLIGSGTSSGTPNQTLQVTGGAFVSSNVGIGTTNPIYRLTVSGAGATVTSGLANAIADFTSSVNGYAQLNVRNSLSGTNASSDLVVTADTGNDLGNYVDLGINNSGFSTSTWTINEALDGYLYSSDTNLSIGVAGQNKYVSFFTDGTLSTNERARINSIGVGIGTTNVTSALTVSGNGLFSGIVTANTFSGTIGTISTFTSFNATLNEITNNNINSSGIHTASRLISTVAQGTAPISVASSTLVSTLNVEYLNGKPAAYYQNASNLTSGIVPADRLSNSNSFTVGGDLYISGNLSIGGTTVVLSADELKIKDKDIILGITTNAFNQDVSTDNSANHGGIAVASTEGYPLVPFQVAGINSLPDTYKQMMWVKGGTFGVGTTDAWLFNYAVGVGSTQVPNGVRLAVGGVQVTDTTVTAVNGNLTNIYGNSLNYQTGYINVGVVTNLSGVRLNYTGVGTIATLDGTNLTFTNSTLTNLNSTNAYIVTGVVTEISGSRLNYSGIGTIANLDGTSLNYGGGSFTNLNATNGYVNTGIITNLTNTRITSGVGTFAILNGYQSNLTNIYSIGVSTFTNGPVLIGSGTSTGTASQRLQVTGGAYVSGNVGIATSNPTQTLDISGTIRLRGAIYDTFNSPGSTDYVLTSGGSSGWSWQPVTSIGAGTLNGIIVKEEGVIVGTAGSIVALDFRGNNIVATAIPYGGVSTITVSDTPSFLSLTVTGNSDLGPSSISSLYVTGVSTYAGISTFLTDVYVGNNLYVGNDVVFDEFTARNITVTGIGTVATLNGTSLNYTNGNIITGIITNLTSVNANLTNINSSGITTTNSLNIGGTQVISSGRQLQNIASLDAVTTATIEAAIANAPNTFTDLQVTGISTLGVTSATNLTAQQLNVSGISTFAGITTVTGETLFTKQLSVSGVSTFIGIGTYVSDLYIGNNLFVKNNLVFDTFTARQITVTETSSLGIASASSLNVTGIGTIATLNATNATINNINSSGIITASRFSTGATGSAINITNNSITGPSSIVIDPAAIGDDTGTVRIKGDLYVDGTQFIVNSQTIELADFNVGIATTVGTNALLDGAGIGIGSANIRKTLTYSFSSDSLKSSENFDLGVGKTYKIGGTDVLSATTLGSGVLNSSLTSVGTLKQLNVTGVTTTSLLNVGIGGTILTTTNGPRVGINSVSPGYTLDVGGSINFTGSLFKNGSEFTSGIGIGSTSVNPQSGVISQRVGVGFTDLNIVGTGISVTGYGSTVVIDFGNIAAAAGGALSISTVFNPRIQDITFVGGATTSRIGISTQNNRFVYDTQTGSVGIGTSGTSIPAYKLDVVGDINSSTSVKIRGTDVLDEATRLAIILG